MFTTQLMSMSGGRGSSTAKPVEMQEPIMMVPGASHHAWTHPPRDSDQESVKTARVRIVDQVIEWLEEEY